MEVRLPGLAGKNFFAMKAWRLGFSHRIRCCDCVLGLSRPPTYFFICWHADVLTVLRLLGALMTMIHVVNRKPEYMDMDMYTSLQHMMKDVDVQSTARRTRNFVARYGIVLIGAKHLYAEAAPAPAQFS